MRVALFGGTFDPIHRGHLAVAGAAADAFALDKVLFAPVGRQPLKLEGTPTGFEDRMAMVRLACEGDVRFVASEVDAPRGDWSPNYTVDTLERLRYEMPDAALFVLVGADSFVDLQRWRRPDLLMELAEWIVVSRPGFSLPKSSQSDRLHVLKGVHEDVSATELRERLERGESCEDLVPTRVLRYIREHHLYWS
jgi:nicotinate-nucleotide adenylyltransferase